MGFELGSLSGVDLGATFGYPIEDSFEVIIGFALVNNFVKWEAYFVLVSLSALGGFIIGTKEGYLVGLLLVITLG